MYAILHVSFIVADKKRALWFYCDVLGLKINHQRPDLGYPGAWLDCGDDQQIHLLELPNPDPVTGRPEHGGRDRHAAFAIEKLDVLSALLEEAGIKFTR
ncbi:MAG: glyoxalase, partial [Gammaproteobacteria bacterium]|nr:glyoxalase [Gammaproteobacteria bacterium]